MITFQVLAMRIAHRVRDCPRDETEWQKASNRLNCTSDVRSTMNKYHCLPADNRTTLLEFCYNRTRTQVVEGTLAGISTKKNIHMILFIQIYSDYLYIISLFVEGSEYGQIQIQIIFGI